MKNHLFILIFMIYVTNASVLNAAEEAYQHVYGETIYAPIPPSQQKLVTRLARWNHDAQAELTKLEISKHPKVVSWLTKIKALDDVAGFALLKQVNRITNAAVVYVDDNKHYHKDYWAPPVETLIEGGDCEDIALLKAVALHIHGLDVKEKGHVLIGMIDWQGKQTAHAVLKIENDDSENYVMRSLNNDVLTFDEMDKIMKPIYMISSKNLVVFKDKDRQFSYNIFDGESLNFSTATGEEKP